jgi:hypothetical protein
MPEEWKEYPGNKDYSVSDMGRVRRTQSLLIVKQKHSGFCFRITEGRMDKLVHRMVAETFIPNEAGHKCVQHKNGETHDNRASNLRWMSNTAGGRKRKIQTSLTDPPTPKSETTELDSPLNSKILKLESKWAAIRISGDDVAIVGVFGSYEEAHDALE